MDQRKLRVGEFLQQDCSEVRAGANAGGRHRYIVLIGFEPGNQLGQVLRRNRFFRSDEMGIGRQQHDRLEILDEIVRERVEGAIGDECAPIAAGDRIAVGRGARDPAYADDPAGTTHIFDDDRLAERGLQVLGQQARKHIRRPARSERHDDRDPTGWIDLCRGVSHGSQAKANRQGCCQNGSVGVHGALLVGCFRRPVPRSGGRCDRRRSFDLNPRGPHYLAPI